MTFCSHSTTSHIIQQNTNNPPLSVSILLTLSLLSKLSFVNSVYCLCLLSVLKLFLRPLHLLMKWLNTSAELDRFCWLLCIRVITERKPKGLVHHLHHQIIDIQNSKKALLVATMCCLSSDDILKPGNTANQIA